MKGNISPLSPPKNISKPVSVKPEQTIKPSQSLSNGSHNSISNSINNDHGNVRVAEGVCFFIFYIFLNEISDVLFFPIREVFNLHKESAHGCESSSS